MPLPKPVDMFDRDWEWGELARFVGDDQPGATLGVVPGRRRQGKTFLLPARRRPGQRARGQRPHVIVLFSGAGQKYQTGNNWPFRLRR